MCRVAKGSLLTVAVTALVACGGDGPAEVQEEAVRPIKLLTVETADGNQSLRYPASVEAADSSVLTFPVGGLLQELPVREAQDVSEGALLARLDQRDRSNQLSSVRAEYDNAETEYQRALRLQEGNAIATSAVEQRKSRRDTAKAQLDTARKALADTELRAPFAGVVAKIHVDRYQNVGPQEPIATVIGERGALEAMVNLPSSVIANSKARRDFAAFVVLDAAPAVRIPAQFKEAALEAVQESQTYEVRFSFMAPDDLRILPGMNATVVIESSAIQEDETVGIGIAVPLDAVLSEADQNYVWVIDADQMTASKRQITLTPGVGDSAIVTEGLRAGETIAGAGAAYLAEGMKVRAWTE